MKRGPDRMPSSSPCAECAPEPRCDIASHLGIAHETVSRSLTALADWGYIGVHHREIEILDADGLERFKRVTRGPAIKPPGGRGGATRRARAMGGTALAGAHSSAAATDLRPSA